MKPITGDCGESFASEWALKCNYDGVSLKVWTYWRNKGWTPQEINERWPEGGGLIAVETELEQP